jgi:hypothetical protein
VLNDDESHPGVGSGAIKKAFQRLDATGGGADPYDRER